MNKFNTPWKYSMENLTETFRQITLARGMEQEAACRALARGLCTPDAWGNLWGVYTPRQVVGYAYTLAQKFGHN